MKDYGIETVDEYIAKAEPEARPTLEGLRKLVTRTVPEAAESISWGVPFYKYHGLLGGFATFKNHASFGLAFQLQDDMRKILEAKGYKTGSKTVQIGFDQEIPTEEIRKILEQKALMNESGSAKNA